MKHLLNKNWPYREIKSRGRDRRNWGAAKEEGIFQHEAMPEHVNLCSDDTPYAQNPVNYARDLNAARRAKDVRAARRWKRNQ